MTAAWEFRVDRAEAVLRVRDTGIGMTEKEIETAMEPFRSAAAVGRRVVLRKKATVICRDEEAEPGRLLRAAAETDSKAAIPRPDRPRAHTRPGGAIGKDHSHAADLKQFARG